MTKSDGATGGMTGITHFLFSRFVLRQNHPYTIIMNNFRYPNGSTILSNHDKSIFERYLISALILISLEIMRVHKPTVTIAQVGVTQILGK